MSLAKCKPIMVIFEGKKSEEGNKCPENLPFPCSCIDQAGTSQVALVVKKLPVQSLGLEDPLEEDVATHQYSCLENPVDKGA